MSGVLGWVIHAFTTFGRFIFRGLSFLDLVFQRREQALQPHEKKLERQQSHKHSRSPLLILDDYQQPQTHEHVKVAHGWPALPLIRILPCIPATDRRASQQTKTTARAKVATASANATSPAV
jgi:hypothetical protein